MKDTMVFIEGPIPSDLIAEQIANYSIHPLVGAHSIFIGQVRSDKIDGRQVSSIMYTVYPEMALEITDTILREVKEKFQLDAASIFHSLKEVKTGQICLFVIAVSKHRKNAIEGCNEIVERIKKDLPVWGKEMFADDSHQWKINK